MALASALAVLAPTTTFARDRDDRRGGDRHEDYREHQRQEFREHDGARFRFGFGVYAAPAPRPANGFYDQYGVWHANGYYDRFGNWHPYGY